MAQLQTRGCYGEKSEDSHSEQVNEVFELGADAAQYRHEGVLGSRQKTHTVNRSMRSLSWELMRLNTDMRVFWGVGKRPTIDRLMRSLSWGLKWLDQYRYEAAMRRRQKTHNRQVNEVFELGADVAQYRHEGAMGRSWNTHTMNRPMRSLSWELKWLDQ